MPPVKSAVKTKRRPLRQWITDVLGETGPLTTTKLRKKVAEKSGAKYHMNSMYLALRSLKKNGVVSATRKGRQRFYALGRAVEAAASKAEHKVVARVAAVKAAHAAAKTAPAAAAVAAAPTTLQSFPHRLAMGEIAIVAVENGTLLSATNVHGELVLKRHPLPTK